MKVYNQTNLYNQSFRGANKLTKSIANGFAKMGEIGEGASITCDFLGKAVVVPVVIMAASKEPKEKKEYSAFKNPVAAVIQLALEVPILMGGTKLIGDLADKGIFDKKDSDFSYNEKKFRQSFVDCFESQAKNDSALKDTKDFIETIKSKGYTKKMAESFDDILEKTGEETSKVLKKSFTQFESVHKNKFHLQNRVCFGAALLLTPLLCKMEDILHPKIMNLLYKNRENQQNGQKLNLSMTQFVAQTKAQNKGGLQWVFKK